ncbi:MAG: hypothetical protein H7287_07515 [Thermoleophilia bacterium]|nr:hypothetical protein [Thermoleophilia bacterium]
MLKLLNTALQSPRSAEDVSSIITAADEATRSDFNMIDVVRIADRSNLPTSQLTRLIYATADATHNDYNMMSSLRDALSLERPVRPAG